MTVDANFLVAPSAPPDGLAEVLSFGEGGDNPCDVEAGQPLEKIVALPGFLDVNNAEVGWSSALCMGVLSFEVPEEGLFDVTVVSPSGVVVTDAPMGDEPGDPVAFQMPNEGGPDEAGSLELYRSAGHVLFRPAIADELGEYTVSIGMNGEQYERRVDVVPADHERGVLLRDSRVGLRDPSEAVFQVTGFESGESVKIALFTNDLARNEARGLSGSGYHFFNQTTVVVDELGQGEVRIPISPTDNSCWAFVANPPSKAEVEASDSNGILDFDDPRFDTICLNLASN